MYGEHKLLCLLHTSTLLGMGDQGREARIAVERIEQRIFLNSQIQQRRQPVVNSLTYKRKRLLDLPFACENGCQIVVGGGSFRLIGAEHAFLNIQHSVE